MKEKNKKIKLSESFKFKTERKILIKLISKSEMERLLDCGIIRNTNKGYVNRKGYHVGHYRTVHHQYIEDWYADKAKTL